MAGRTLNLDQLASEGMRFTDYYAEASCTAGRANFITGELSIRTGLTTVGQAGATIGIPDEAPTIATVLKSMGYATGFGKNQDSVRRPHHPEIDYCPIVVSPGEPAGDPANDRFGVIFAAKDCTAIFPFRIMNVSVASS